MAVFSYWVWFGLFYLLWLTYQDVWRGNRIDDRKNWFMMGLSISLYSHGVFGLWYVLLVVLVSLFTGYLINRTGFFAKGDTNAFSWLIVGFVILNGFVSGVALWFVISLVVVTCLWVGLSKLFARRLRLDRPIRAAFFPVILVSFVFVCWLFGLF